MQAVSSINMLTMLSMFRTRMGWAEHTTRYAECEWGHLLPNWRRWCRFSLQAGLRTPHLYASACSEWARSLDPASATRVQVQQCRSPQLSAMRLRICAQHDNKHYMLRGGQRLSEDVYPVPVQCHCATAGPHRHCHGLASLHGTLGFHRSNLCPSTLVAPMHTCAPSCAWVTTAKLLVCTSVPVTA